MQLRALDQHDRVPCRTSFRFMHYRFTVLLPQNIIDSLWFFLYFLGRPGIASLKDPRLWVWRKISRSAKLTPLKCVRLGSVPCAQKSAAKRPIWNRVSDTGCSVMLVWACWVLFHVAKWDHGAQPWLYKGDFLSGHLLSWYLSWYCHIWVFFFSFSALFKFIGGPGLHRNSSGLAGGLVSHGNDSGAFGCRLWGPRRGNWRWRIDFSIRIMVIITKLIMMEFNSVADVF